MCLLRACYAQSLMVWTELLIALPGRIEKLACIQYFPVVYYVKDQKYLQTLAHGFLGTNSFLAKYHCIKSLFAFNIN